MPEMETGTRYRGIVYKGIRNKGIGYKIFNIKYLICLAISSVFSLSAIQAQTKTNLDIFYSLVDSSVKEFIAHIPESKDSIILDLNFGEDYSVFENKLIAGIYSSGKIITEENTNALNVNYIIDDVSVVYGEIFRDGLFGDYYIYRNLSLKGNYLVRGNSTFFKEFNFSYNDSIKYVEISNVENESYPFTKGDIPAEPFFSGLFEPVLAIGTAALAVVLFFTIRSK